MCKIRVLKPNGDKWGDGIFLGFGKFPPIFGCKEEKYVLIKYTDGVFKGKIKGEPLSAIKFLEFPF